MVDFRTLLEREQDDVSIFKPIQAGKYELSIQASHSHYCQPRVNGLQSFGYESFELAVFKDGTWILPPTNDYLKTFEWVDKFKTGKSTSVAGYMSVELTQQIYKDLTNL